MTETARVVVVGGGVVGCSVLYHLTRKGWSDVTLCERSELTAGSTWHAAGHVITYTSHPTVSRLNSYGANLYAELEALTGQNPGYHRCGNLRIATSPDRMDEYRRYLGLAEITGVAARLLTPGEIKQAWPFMDMGGVLGGLLNPMDGHIAPADLTQAFAIGARAQGARIKRGTEVLGFERAPDGRWAVNTTQGEIRCDHVVSCTGNYSKQTLAMVGLSAQTVSLKHEYIITEPVPALAERRRQGLPELPVMRDPNENFYVRQEGDGLLMGCYEGRGECVFTDGVPGSFGMQLFPDELDKLLPFLERAIERVPLLETAGIRTVVNGPQPYTPDDIPITGPAFGLENFWLGEGNPNGVTLSGGIGWQLAEWIVEGAPSIDMTACDPQRFGAYATRTYSMRKTEEAYERTYLIPLPGEELPACRPLKTTPLHDALETRGAVFGSIYGWERPNWFAPPGIARAEAYSFRTPDYLEHVRAECRAVRTGMVVADISHGSKFRVQGIGAAHWLSGVLDRCVPERGRYCTAYILSITQTFRAQFRVFREQPDSFVLEAPPQVERAFLDVLRRTRMPSEILVENLTGREGCLLLSGPDAPELLGRLSRAEILDRAPEEMGDAAFPVGTGRIVTVGYASVRAMRTDSFGVPGWELHCDSEVLRHVFRQVTEAAGSLHMIGARALDALRLARAEPAWGTELSMGRTVAEAGQCLGAATRRLVLLSLGDPGAPIPFGEEPVRSGGGELVGHTTSGGIDVASDGCLAFAYVDARMSAPGTSLRLQLLGELYPVTIRSRVGDRDEVL